MKDRSRKDDALDGSASARLILVAAAAVAVGAVAWLAFRDSGLSDGHRRMLARLAEIERSAPLDHPYLGTDQLTIRTEEFEKIGPHTPVRARWWTQLHLARAQLRLGMFDAAIANFEGAREVALANAEELDEQAVLGTLYSNAVGWLRIAETNNCVAHHTSESCLFPIVGGGVHVDRQASQNARDRLLEMLERSPGHPAARWLLCLTAMTLGEYPDSVPEADRLPEAALRSATGFPRFPDRAAEAGVNMVSLAGGAVAADLNGDGVMDLFVTTWDPARDPYVLLGRGDGTFEDTTDDSGLRGIRGGLNVLPADYDGDGDVDLFVLRGAWLGKHGRHPNSLLRNDGDARFEDVTFEAGLGDEFPTQAGGWADYDNDGDLDLYVACETDRAVPEPARLYRNDGAGRFDEVGVAAGVTNMRYAKAAVWGDYDGDRFPDIYVSNREEPNRLYRNQGDGTFVDVAPELGLERPVRSFTAWWFDYDNDGVLDLFVGGYGWDSSQPGIGPIVSVAADFTGDRQTGETARLYRGNGTGGFEDVTQAAGLARPFLPMGGNFGDLDGDGFPEIYLGTGNPALDSVMPNVMLRGRADGTFDDITIAGGFGHLQKGHGVAFADFDGDGDQDLFEQLGGAFPVDEFANALFDNPGTFGNHWLRVRLVGDRSNRDGIGARLRAVIQEDGVTRSVYRHVNTGGSFGANPIQQTLGLGKATRVERLEVFWPTTGHTQVLENLEVDREITVEEEIGGAGSR